MAMQLRSLVELYIIPCLYLCLRIKKTIGRNSQPEYVWLRLPSPAPSSIFKSALRGAALRKKFRRAVHFDRFFQLRR